MRKRRRSGGQDFRIVCACFVVASSCATGLAQDAILDKDPSDAKDLKRTKIEAAKHHDHFSRIGGVRPPVQRPRIVRQTKASPVENRATDLGKKGAHTRDERRAKMKQDLVACDELKKSSDEVQQEARLIFGMTIGEFREMRRAEVEWRRQLRDQLAIENPIHEQRTDGLDEAKNVAREQARKVADEVKTQTRRE